jgi:L-rhamnose isomerase/sugar isomerase
MTENPILPTDEPERDVQAHARRLAGLAEDLRERRLDLEDIVRGIQAFEVQVPSWGVGVGGTRFGRFPQPGMPNDLEDKLDDIAVLNRLCGGAAGAVSLHIPWDEPRDPKTLVAGLSARGLRIGSVNSNTFQDRPGQRFSYRFGSLAHVDPEVRDRAVEHNRHVIEVGRALGARSLTVWVADGSNYPGQIHSRRAFERYVESCRRIHEVLPDDWTMALEHKPFEPATHHSVNMDWGTSHLAATRVGDRCRCLVDFGHHPTLYPIDVVVAMLVADSRLAGFHFNDRRWADDDCTAGSVAPYQLFLVFCELAMAARDPDVKGFSPEYMIDQSEAIKDPLEALLQTVDALQLACAQSLLVDYEALFQAQARNDVLFAERELQRAFRTDARPLVAEARRRRGGALDPVESFRRSGYREAMARKRPSQSGAAGTI